MRPIFTRGHLPSLSHQPSIRNLRQAPAGTIAARNVVETGDANKAVAAFLAVTALILPGAKAQAQTLSVYLSAPQSTSTIYSNTTVETFESLATGNYQTSYTSVLGTYALNSTTQFSIQPNNDYSAGVASGKYMAFGSQSGTSTPITLTLNSAQSYFGFSWNAGDANNGLTFYSGNNLIGRFSTTTLLNLLKNTTVTALDNSTYQSENYYGKPGTGSSTVKSTRTNNAEPYAFVNFIASSGLTFDRIVFDNSNSVGTGFESDNHTILAAQVSPDNSLVLVTQINSPVAPEPGSLALLLPGIGAFGVVLRKRRKI